jgi:hypothetical protein
MLPLQGPPAEGKVSQQLPKDDNADEEEGVNVQMQEGEGEGINEQGENSQEGGGLDAKLEEFKDPETLGAYQTRITKGIGVIATENAVVLIFAKGMTSHVYTYAAATSLSHLPDCNNCVSTALHCMAAAIESYGRNGELTVWAILAKEFLTLDEDSKANMDSLRDSGAVKALRFYSSAKDMGLDLLRHPGWDSLIVHRTLSYRKAIVRCSTRPVGN